MSQWSRGLQPSMLKKVFGPSFHRNGNPRSCKYVLTSKIKITLHIYIYIERGLTFVVCINNYSVVLWKSIKTGKEL